MKLFVITSLILVSLTGSYSAAGDEPYYRWIDENGVVNYSQEKPRGIDSIFFSDEVRFGYREQDKPTALPTSPAPPRTDDETSNEIERVKQQEFEETMKAFEEQKKLNCDHARRRMASYTSRGRIRLKGADGEYQTLTGEERQEKIDNFQKDIDENCS